MRERWSQSPMALTFLLSVLLVITACAMRCDSRSSRSSNREQAAPMTKTEQSFESNTAVTIAPEPFSSDLGWTLRSTSDVAPIASTSTVPVVKASTIRSKSVRRAEATTERRQGFLLPIATHNGRFRINLILNSNAMVPDRVWKAASFRAAIGVDSTGRFPVRVWARRDGVWSLAETLRIDAQSLGWLQVNGIAQRWNVEDGDMIAIEYTIALLSFECDTDRSCGPVVSIVDNVSNDPLTYLPHMSEF